MTRPSLFLAALLFACAGGNNNNGAEDCQNDLDDDADGLVDCGDPDCAAEAFCENPPAVVGGFAAPESVFFDPTTEAWYVTNQGGGGGGDGFISKLDAAGNVVDLDFATGLDNPRGIRAAGNQLFVADNAGVLIFDLATGQRLDTVAIAGAGFLNDIAVDPATLDVYVSDTSTNSIHRIVGGQAELFVQDAQLGGPNGLLVDGGALLAAGFNGGQIFSVDLADRGLSLLANVGGNLDGLERDGADLLTTDFSGRLLRVNAQGQTAVLVDGTDGSLAAAADIGFDAERRVVAIPELGGTEVSFFDLDEL